MTSQRDIQLVITAKDNASRVASAVTTALDALGRAQAQVAAGGGDTAGALAAVTKALGQLDAVNSRSAAGYDKVSAKLATQKTELASTRETLTALEQSAERAGQSLFKLAQAQLAGDGGAAAKRKLVLADYEELAREIPKVSAQVLRQETAIEGSGRALAAYAGSINLASNGLEVFGTKADRLKISVAAAVEAASNDLLRLDRSLSAAQREITGSRAGPVATPSSNAAALIAESNKAAAAFDEQNRALDALNAEVGRFRDRLDPARAAQARLDAELERARVLYSTGKISIRELVAEQKRLEVQSVITTAALRNGTGGSTQLKGLFGLRPYELQNLGYQVNDLVTQLASGTSLTQALSQQSGQILQLFPQQLAGVLKYGRAIGLIAVAVAPVLIGLNRLFDQQSSLREFNATVAASGDAATFQGEKLARAAQKIQQFGVSTTEAKGAVSALLAAGIDPARFEAFGQAARNASDVLGIKLVDAAKDSATAFTSGYNAVAEFDDKLNFLTASEREHIRAMFESGETSKAREEAFRLFFDRMEEGAAKSRGPWADAVRSLQIAWTDFADYLATSTVINSIGDKLTLAVKAAAYLLNSISGGNKLQTAQQNVNLYTNEIIALKKEIAASPTAKILKTAQLEAYVKKLAEAQKLVIQLQNQQSKETAARKDSSDPKGDTEKAKKQHDERIHQLELERGAVGQVSDAQKIRTEGEKAYRAEINKTGDAVAAAYARETATIKKRDEITKANAGRLKKEAEDAKNSTRLISPVSGPLTSGFGKRASPGGVGSKFHLGNDFGVPTGTPVRAVADGKATVTSTEKGGLTVTLDLGNGYKAAFAHLSESLVKTGDIVQQGQTIAKSGNSGTATTGAHLHFGLSKNGDPLDPSKTKSIKVASGTPFQEAAVDQEKLAVNQLATQTKINDELADDVAKRQQIADRQTLFNGLQNQALLVAQRQVAIDDAIAAAKERANEQSEALVTAGGVAVTLSEKQLADVKAIAAAEFDATHAREAAGIRRQQIEQAVNVLLEQRQALQERIQFAQQQGQPGVVGELETQLDTVNTKLTDATAKAIAFWQAVRSDPSQLALLGVTTEQVDNLILGMENARAGAARLNTQFIATGKSINEDFAQGVVSAIDGFAQAVAGGANVFDSLGKAFLQFASQFLIKIAQMILQQVIFNAISGGSGGGGGGAGGAIGGFLAGLFHEGGVVGSGGGLRAADPSWFTNAKRYHSGGIAGLAPNEVPSILQRGEEVLTANDPRHISNGGTGGSARMPDIKVVNTIDAGDFVSQGLGTKYGEKAILNLIRANPRAFKSAMGT